MGHEIFSGCAKLFSEAHKAMKLSFHNTADEMGQKSFIKGDFATTILCEYRLSWTLCCRHFHMKGMLVAKARSA